MKISGTTVLVFRLENIFAKSKFLFPRLLRKFVFVQRAAMNIQDESFPHDGLEFSDRFITQEAIASTITPPPTNANTSASSSSSSIDQQIRSTESITRRTPLEVSSKTASSDPIGLAVQGNNASDEKYDEDFQSNQPQLKSFHDIHNKYTMRRYRHVESKVGQYIASIKAAEQKRRALFQRHRSMPTSLKAQIKEDDPHQRQEQQQEQESLSMRHSTTDLYAPNGNGSSGTSRHESSDDALNGADFIDKLTYAQLVDEKEYIEMKLKEKSSENFRLRRNVDYLRIELTTCQDKLKRLSNSSNSNLSNFSSAMGYSYCGSGSGTSVDAFGRCFQHPTTETRATQTDCPAFVLRTPIPASLKAHCNVLRQRTNSNSSAQKLKATDSMRVKYYNSSECDFGSSEIRSHKPKICKALSQSFSSSDASPKSSPSPSSSSRSPPLGRKTRQSTQNNFPTARYAALTMLNESANSNIELDENATGRCQTAIFISSASSHPIKRQPRRTTLSQRFKRLFLRCTSCSDTNEIAESYIENVHMTQSPARLLNRKENSMSGL